MSVSDQDFEYPDGKSPAAWVGSIGCAIGFVIVAVCAMLGPAWPGVWTGVAIVAVSLIATLILQANGYGRYGKR